MAANRSAAGGARHDRPHASVGGLTLRLAHHRLRPRHHAGGDARRRADRRRLLRRAAAAQPFPRDLRRGRVQRRLRAGLCAHARSRAAPTRPRLFADRIFTLLLASQVVLLAVALAFTPAVIAPAGARASTSDPARFALAVELTRITFPYLLLMTLVTLLRRHPQCASTASPPRPPRRSCSISR